MGDTRQIEKKFMWKPAVVSLLVLLLGFLAALVLYGVVYPTYLGVRQPIPFSHRVHVYTKHISCMMCHSQVATSARAGIPPLQTCLLCHERIIRTHPYIVKLREHFQQGKPVIWERVNWVPEFVYFNHSMHINKGIDCGICHGDVSMMDRVVPKQEFQMGFCIECHRRNNATHDCMGCHR
ncbi:cytochrome c3 family protein [Pelotalea chapellei]